MIELINGMDFHNFNLDCKPKEWFKRNKEKETVGEWLTRVSYHPKRDFLQDLRFREKNEYDILYKRIEIKRAPLRGFIFVF